MSPELVKNTVRYRFDNSWNFADFMEQLRFDIDYSVNSENAYSASISEDKSKKQNRIPENLGLILIDSLAYY